MATSFSFLKKERRPEWISIKKKKEFLKIYFMLKTKIITPSEMFPRYLEKIFDNYILKVGKIKRHKWK